MTDPDGKPVAGAEVAVLPDFQSNEAHWRKTATNGAFSLSWSLQPWQSQSGGGALLVARDPARNLAASAELPETTSNLDLQLKPALTLNGLVKNADNSPLAGAQISVQIHAGAGYSPLNGPSATSDAHGRYQIKCLPPGESYFVAATAEGRGKGRLEVHGNVETNRVELSPLPLKVANRVLAGQVLNDKGKSVSGANVSINGDGQPDAFMTTDSKGRFHFLVCEGQVRLFANAQQVRGFAQTTAAAGDTNVVLTFGVQQVPRGVDLRGPRPRPAVVLLKGSPLPDLASVNLAGNAAPDGQAVRVCLFDAGQRASRQVMRQLNEQAGALRQQGVIVLGAQALVTSGEIFNQWRSSSPVSFPLGRVLEKSEKTKWVLAAPELPWLILADSHHSVVAEGFAFDELDAQIKKLAKCPLTPA